VEIEYPDKTEIRVLAGERAWRGNAPTITPVAGPPKVAMQYQLLRLRPAWALSHYRDRVVLGEDVVRDRAPHRTLTLTWSPELSIDFLVDTETHRITHVSAQLRFGTTMLSFATHYSEFQFIDGVLIPFKEENYASNRRTATTRIQSIELSAQALGPFSLSP